LQVTLHIALLRGAHWTQERAELLGVEGLEAAVFDEGTLLGNTLHTERVGAEEVRAAQLGAGHFGNAGMGLGAGLKFRECFVTTS